jgi:hypothetical protein
VPHIPGSIRWSHFLGSKKVYPVYHRFDGFAPRCGMYPVHTRYILVCTGWTTCTDLGNQATFVCLWTTIYSFNTPSFICHSPISPVCLLSTFQRHFVQTSTYWYVLLMYKYILIMMQFTLHSNQALSPLLPSRVSFLCLSNDLLAASCFSAVSSIVRPPMWGLPCARAAQPAQEQHNSIILSQGYVLVHTQYRPSMYEYVQGMYWYVPTWIEVQQKFGLKEWKPCKTGLSAILQVCTGTHKIHTSIYWSVSRTY